MCKCIITVEIWTEASARVSIYTAVNTDEPPGSIKVRVDHGKYRRVIGRSRQIPTNPPMKSGSITVNTDEPPGRSSLAYPVDEPPPIKVRVDHGKYRRVTGRIGGEKMKDRRKTMNLPRFEDFTIAGMAVMYTTNYTFDITVLFPLIPIAWTRLDSPVEGDIVSAKYGDYQRGCTSVSSGCMKNMIMLRMRGSSDSNISIKFNSDKIHICGTKDYDTPRYICRLLLSTLDTLYDTIIFIKDNRELYSRIIEEALSEDLEFDDTTPDQTKTYELMLGSMEGLSLEPMKVPEPSDDIDPSEFISRLNSLRDRYDPLVIDFITNQVYDYVTNSYRTDVHGYLNQVLGVIDNINIDDIPDKFDIVREDTNMLNYNYDMSDIVGRPVRLVKYDVLERLMPVRNCVIHSDNRMKQNITLHILSQDGYIHRLIINRNGKIIHSSHDQRSMSRVYRELVTLLLDCTQDVDLYKTDRYDLDEIFGS